MVNQLNRTIDVIEEAIDELIEMRDNWFPVGSGFSDELSEFTAEKLYEILNKIESKKWYDDIGQEI